MNKVIILFVFIFGTLFFSSALAQEKKSGKKYWLSASEFIFSGSELEATGGPLITSIDINPVLRFSGFFHLQQQFHIDFNKNFGIFTGVGVRNVGMINELNDSIKIKQRVYSLGVPLALKLGALPNKFHVNIGGELEFFFHYKQKVFYEDEKFKKNEWVSDKVNLLNPSVFLDLHSGKGAYVRVKYYLLDFLVKDKQEIKINGIAYNYFPDTSKLFYISVGTTIKSKSSRTTKKAGRPVDTTSLN